MGHFVAFRSRPIPPHSRHLALDSGGGETADALLLWRRIPKRVPALIAAMERLPSATAYRRAQRRRRGEASPSWTPQSRGFRLRGCLADSTVRPWTSPTCAASACARSSRRATAAGAPAWTFRAFLAQWRFPRCAGVFAARRAGHGPTTCGPTGANIEPQAWRADSEPPRRRLPTESSQYARGL